MLRADHPMDLPSLRHRASANGAIALLLACWALHLILSPLYVFPSGNPQPADVLMAALILLVLSGMIGRLPLYGALYTVLGLLVLVIALVNLTWFSVYYRPIFVKSTSYYMYNALIVVFVVCAMRRAPEAMLKATTAGLFVAVMAQVVIVMLSGGGFRGTGGFNNPNQLGYWGILGLCCWLVARGRRPLGLLDLCFYAGTANVVLASLSKAAIIALGAITLIALLAHGVRGRWFAGALGLVLVGTQLYFALPPAWQERSADVLAPHVMVEKVGKRFDSLGRHNDDSLIGRGYDRIWRHPEYLLFGAGEGQPGRFTGPDAGFNELHSSWGTLFFSYGLPGVGLFIVLLVLIFRHALVRHLLYFIPIAFYGLAHQGLRFSTFWVFLGLVYGVAQWQRGASRSPADAAAPARSRGDGPPGAIAGQASRA